MRPKAKAPAAAAGCAPVDFGQASINQMADFDSTGTTLYAALLYRLADGSFTAQGFSAPAGVTNPVSTNIGSVAQAQTIFAGCSGANSWTPKPHPTLMANLPGTMSRLSLVANLGGTPYAEIGVASGNVITVGLDTQTTLGNSLTNYPVGTSPYGVLTADFNGDGKTDVAVVATGGSSPVGTVSILLGNGDGTLRPAVNYNVGQYPEVMTSFDFNHDGRADLAVVNYSDNSVTILLANPDGSMRTANTYALPGDIMNGGPYAIVAADFDGDGKTDLMVFSLQGFTLLRGNGDGSFQTPLNAAAYPNYRPIYLAAGDFNKDGKPDLASLNSDATVTILWNAGDGTFASQSRYVVGTPLTTGNYMPSLFAMDFNDDGNLDVVVAAGHPDALFPNPMFVTVLFGNGDGTFQGAAAAWDAGYGPSAVAMGDFNGDGLRDLVVAVPGTDPLRTGSSNLRILLGKSGGGFQPATELSWDTASMLWVTAADLDGDGHTDLVGVDTKSLVHTWQGNGDGTFQKGVTYAAGTKPTFVTVGDANGDGRPDLIVAYGDPSITYNGPTSVLVMTAKSTGGFNTGVSVTTGTNTVQVALVDVNGDGKLDLIAVNLGYAGSTAGNVSVLLGKGDGTFQAPMNYTVGLNPAALAAADLNGDGKLDLIVGTVTAAGSKIAVLPGNGNGTFGAATLLDTYSTPISLAVADFDGDGKLDLAIVHAAGDSPATIMPGNGDGTFWPEYPILMGDSPVAAIAADFTGDGRPDLVVLDQVTSGHGDWGTVALFRNASPTACTYSLSASGASQPIAMAGGTGSFGVIAGTGCDWIAAGSADWIRPVFPSWGSNNGTVRFTVLANSGPTRTGTVTVGGKTYAITQTGTGVPQWTIAKSHAGNFTQGQNGAAYTIRVSNSGTAASSGAVTVTENVPAGLTLVSMAGQGWTCPAGGNTCTRSDALNTGASFPDISVTVNVAASAASSVTNQASVSGGGAVSSASASDSTTITPASIGGVPQALSVYPPAGTGSYASYTFTFSDSAGWQNISVANVLISNFINGIGACYVAVVPSSSSVLLVDDAGDAGGPYQGMVLPGSGTVENSQCSIAAAGSSIAGSGNTLTVMLAITFKAAFAGNKVMYLAARESGGANSGWQALGTCGVPGGSVTGPAVGGVTPARSSGTGGGSFVFTFTDTNGWQDLGVVNVLINDALNGNGACYLAYSRAYNTLYLVNDAGNGLLPGLTLSGTGTLGNSQCTVTGAGSSASGSGNTLTLTLNMNFASTFAGNRIIYMAARSNGDLLNSGWQAAGSRTVQ